jgi:hypothetical protein
VQINFVNFLDDDNKDDVEVVDTEINVLKDLSGLPHHLGEKWL